MIEPTDQLPPEKQFGGLTDWKHDYLPDSDLCNGPWSEIQKQAIQKTVKQWHETRSNQSLQNYYNKVLNTLLGENYYVQLELTDNDKADPAQLMNDIDDLWLDYLEPRGKSLGLTITYYHIITLSDYSLEGLNKLKD